MCPVDYGYTSSGTGRTPHRRLPGAVAPPPAHGPGHNAPPPTPAPKRNHLSPAEVQHERDTAHQLIHHLTHDNLNHRLPAPATVGYAFHWLTPEQQAHYGPILLHRYVRFGGSPPESLSRFNPRKAANIRGLHRDISSEVHTDQGSNLERAVEFGSLVAPVGLGVDALRGGVAAVRAAQAAKGAEEAGKAADVIRLAEEGAARASKAAEGGRVARTAARAREARTATRAAAEAKTARVVKAVTAERKVQRGVRAVKAATHARAGTLALAPVAGGKGATAAIAADVAKGGGPIAALGGAFIQGHAQALAEHPGDTLATTARAVPGILTYPLTVAGDVGTSGIRAARTGLEAAGLPGGKHYSGSQITAPLKGAANEAYQGLKQPLDTFTSGDPNKIQQAVEHKYGLSFAVPIPALSRLKAVKAAQDLARDVTKTGRKGLAARGHTVRHGPEGRREHVFRATENRRTRTRVAAMAGRAQRRGEYSAHRAAIDVLKPLRKAKLTRSLRHRKGLEAGDAVQILAEYGVSRDPDLYPHQLAALAEHLPNSPGAHEGAVTGHAVLGFLHEHPEVLRDPHLWRAVDAYKHHAAAITTSERARLMSQGDLFGVQRPEDAVPHAARELTNAATREEAHAEAKAAQKAHDAKRAEARATLAAAEARGVTEADRLRIATLHHEARGHGAHAKALRRALKYHTKPGVALRTSLRTKPWDRALLDEYAAKVNEAAAKHGFEEPAYTHHAVLSQQHEGQVHVGSMRTATRVQQVRTAGAHAEIDRSLHELVSGSIYGPRHRRAGIAFTNEFVSSEAVPIEKANGQRGIDVTRDDYDHAVRTKQLSGKHYVFFPARWFKQSVTDPFVTGTELTADLKKRLEGTDPGEKGVIVSAEAAKEFEGQVNPVQGAIERVLNASSKGASRILLGLSPGWALAQIAAEGLPVLISHNPARLARAAAAVHKLPQVSEEAAHGWAALAGETPALLSSPSDLRLQVDNHTMAQASGFTRAIENNRIGRALLSTAKLRPLGLFDRWKGGKYRSVLMAAEADKRLNGFISGVHGLVRESARVSEELRGKPLHEQLAYMAEHPQKAAELESYLNDVMGNWTSYTRFERQFAPALIFYPFIRYSLRWMFWTFPKRHPVKAQILYFLGQQNANQLQKILGAKPANFGDYGTALVHSGPGGAVGETLPVGARIAPGLNAVVQAAGGNNPAGLIQALNPALGEVVTATTGVSPLSGTQTSQGRGTLALNQLLSMPAPLRLAGVRLGTQSSGSKDYAKSDPLATERSALLPYLPRTLGQEKSRNDLLRSFASGSSSSSSGGYKAPWQSGSTSSSSSSSSGGYKPPWQN